MIYVLYYLAIGFVTAGLICFTGPTTKEKHDNSIIFIVFLLSIIAWPVVIGIMVYYLVKFIKEDKENESN